MILTTEQSKAFATVSEADRSVIRTAVLGPHKPQNTYCCQFCGKDTLFTGVRINEDVLVCPTCYDIEFDEDEPEEVDSEASNSDPAPVTVVEEPKQRRIPKTQESKANRKMLVMFQDLYSRAVEEEITVTKAIKIVLEKFPDATRVEFKHTAAMVGIHPLTARNLYDRITKAAK